MRLFDAAMRHRTSSKKAWLREAPVVEKKESGKLEAAVEEVAPLLQEATVKEEVKEETSSEKEDVLFSGSCQNVPRCARC